MRHSIEMRIEFNSIQFNSIQFANYIQFKLRKEWMWSSESVANMWY
jgi:hypothetical protein